MPEGYRYKGRLADVRYFRSLVERDVAPVLGITVYPSGEFVVFFDRKLTDEEKGKLDALVASNPTPVHTVETEAADLREEIAKIVGVKPVRVDWDYVTGRARADFDVRLTPEQEASVKSFLENLRNQARGRSR